MNQLSRIIRSEPTGGADEQAAAPDERGSYGELVEEIDRLLETTVPKAHGPGAPGPRPALWTEHEEA